MMGRLGDGTFVEAQQQGQKDLWESGKATEVVEKEEGF